eukprot:4296218-Amphidinium_carterae.2
MQADFAGTARRYETLRRMFLSRSLLCRDAFKVPRLKTTPKNDLLSLVLRTGHLHEVQCGIICHYRDGGQHSAFLLAHRSLPQVRKCSVHCAHVELRIFLHYCAKL